jgi:hypothetical protein
MTRKVRERSRRRRFWKRYVIRAYIKAELGGHRRRTTEEVWNIIENGRKTIE